jgi:hypothetical protein
MHLDYVGTLTVTPPSVIACAPEPYSPIRVPRSVACGIPHSHATCFRYRLQTHLVLRVERIASARLARYVKSLSASRARGGTCPAAARPVPLVLPGSCLAAEDQLDRVPTDLQGANILVYCSSPDVMRLSAVFDWRVNAHRSVRSLTYQPTCRQATCLAWTAGRDISRKPLTTDFRFDTCAHPCRVIDPSCGALAAWTTKVTWHPVRRIRSPQEPGGAPRQPPRTRNSLSPPESAE